MDLRQVFAIGLVVAAGVGAHAAGTPKPGVDWPQFRGIRAGGVAEGFPLAEAWDIPSGRGVRWKTAIPGLGLASPVVWGDLICLSTSISGQKDAGLKVGLYGDVRPVTDDTEHEWRVYCLDKKSGAVRWQQTRAEGRSEDQAAHQVVTRQFHVGHRRRTPDRVLRLGRPLRLRPAEASCCGRRISASSTPDGSAIRRRSGKRAARRSFTTTWSSSRWTCRRARSWAPSTRATAASSGERREPTCPPGARRRFIRSTASTQLIVNGWRHIGAYDFKTGKEIWRLTGGGDIPVPTPVVQDGLIYITNAHGPQAPVYAIRETATGDITLAEGASSNQGVAWSVPRDGGYMCTPLVYRGLVYIVKYNGVLIGLRREDRRGEIPAAACRRQVGVHVIPGGVRWQGVSRQRGRACLRAQGRPDLRADRRERHGRERAGDAGDLRGPADLSHPGQRRRRRWRSQAVTSEDDGHVNHPWRRQSCRRRLRSARRCRSSAACSPASCDASARPTSGRSSSPRRRSRTARASSTAG